MTKVSRPGQSMPNEFETEILERIALNNPSLREHFGRLHVLIREFTGVGSYTNFGVPEIDAQVTRTHLDLDALIVVPNVENGMCAVLFCRGGRPECLEIATFGDASWDGVFDGFSMT